jgi:hypothetical protein
MRPIWAVISSVARAVWPASSLTSAATTAKPRVAEADQTAQLVQDLSGAVARIGDVVTMITGIASQIWAVISSVARAVWPASSLTSAATTAKPRPASPAPDRR